MFADSPRFNNTHTFRERWSGSFLTISSSREFLDLHDSILCLILIHDFIQVIDKHEVELEARFSVNRKNTGKFVCLLNSRFFSLIRELRHPGTHSNRKSSRTFSNSLIGGPNETIQRQRGGWKCADGVTDTYAFPTPGGDQLIGRVLSGLPYYTKEFSALPPHFADEQTLTVRRFVISYFSSACMHI
jgi:hypothetical protein